MNRPGWGIPIRSSAAAAAGHELSSGQYPVDWFVAASIFPQTALERLARLNSVAGIVEFDVDESGKIAARSWEWK